MLANILWGLFLVLFVAMMIYLDKRKQKKRYYTHGMKKGEKTEKEKEVDRAIEKEKSFRGGPPGPPSGGGGGF
ncbi:hypothetical protein SAMN05216353_15819 [Halobacillus alkaliphilus]|uniref:Uncharacterized protein n=1 Tax=Halobacillus alkaliphilus TaxID=396056 RepID=A0A1I2SYL6_9BACI|nr:hypothetical protein [Halobacillus alkaliphilus]SFG57708.1 hypothetical protein SAMN05216353_15819 [Halobacillus alkaliphilus]